MSSIPDWLFFVLAVGVVGMLYSIAVAVEGLVKVTNAQNEILNEMRRMVSKRFPDKHDPYDDFIN